VKEEQVTTLVLDGAGHWRSVEWGKWWAPCWIDSEIEAATEADWKKSMDTASERLAKSAIARPEVCLATSAFFEAVRAKSINRRKFD
jgi:hypothetical protein